ncbi:MAG: ABC transporter permease subunit [Rickettsiaceae bacterium]|nr:ABC transporter permease subunit [Rickettsiaceae bacterium]
MNLKQSLTRLYYNIVVLAVLLLGGIFFIHGLMLMNSDISTLNPKIVLGVSHLPQYLFRTGMRFIVSMIFSILVAIVTGSLAAKNQRMAYILMPLVDVLQAIPILGFLSFTVMFFVGLAPNTVLGVEMAIIFATFTSQAWNMIMSVYQSLLSVPLDLYDTAKAYKLNKWQIFWKMEIPFCMPGLVWNSILSMCASWYFVVAGEVVCVGVHDYKISGIGAYIALALKNMDFQSVFYAFLGIVFLSIIFNEFFFKPFVAWSSKFRYEFAISGSSKYESWLFDYLSRADVTILLTAPLNFIKNLVLSASLPRIVSRNIRIFAVFFESMWWVFVAICLWSIYKSVYSLIVGKFGYSELVEVIKLGLITTVRVFATAILASIFLIPFGIYVGVRPKLAAIIQPINLFLTSVPANLYYPLFVILIVKYNLNVNIWLSYVIMTGSMSYILYNVISGAQTIPTELLEVADVFKLSKFWKLFKITIPAILPFYLTGFMTCTGASWNASVVSEIVKWGNTTLVADGLGSYIAIHTRNGDFAEIALGLIIMTILVLLTNTIALKPLYSFISTRFRLE